MDIRVLLVAPRAGRLTPQEIQLAKKDLSRRSLNSRKYKQATVISCNRALATTHRGPRISAGSPPKRKRTPTSQPMTSTVPGRIHGPRAESRTRHPRRARQHRLSRTSTAVLQEGEPKATAGIKDAPNRHHHFRSSATAEAAAIALAIREAERRGRSAYILTDSQAACRLYLRGTLPSPWRYSIMNKADKAHSCGSLRCISIGSDTCPFHLITTLLLF
ncbi:hypothetical protein HPB51_028517 [Rhipicephalus microplus]|uniref:Tick transposon n=1 Tax=Rhipicephalus microplus TaxID=6941 RepID=A0A9J6CWP3_RHIMP|nr:hypothetical protein HPB51_028517 [Rhipicephalus microplus]